MDHEVSTSYAVLERMLFDESAEPTSLPLSLLQYITNHFSLDHQIGSGGFAVVYKGTVGKGMVAIKKLFDTYGIHEKKFEDEIQCLIKAKHKNIVRFLGYCSDTQKIIDEYEGKVVMAEKRNHLLCFEYACNGSLDQYINDASRGLNWKEHCQIIKGICEGLLFLHENSIIHLDLKPGNILLDGHMVPKITDFGLSRRLGKDQTRAITQNILGTRGYADPEYLKTGEMVPATDIYSLGVLIMEILIGKRLYPEDESLIESWMNQLEASHGDMKLEQVRVCIKIGMECMRVDPKKRPVAQDIVDRLNEMPSAEYSGETVIKSSLVDLQVSLPRDQFGERSGKLAVENLEKADIEEHHEILEDVAESLGRLHSEEWQREADHKSSWGAPKQKVNRRGSSVSSSISTMFSKLSNLDIFNRKAHRNSDKNSMRALERSHIIKIFKKGELKPILKSSNLIGKGGFGEVYKGLLDNDLVAVKKPISGNVMETEQFKNEVIIQSQVIHRNIVRLIGCCLEMDNPMLVYEYLTNGSLDGILHESNKVPLSLDVRLAIVTGSANGLAYLHSQTRTIIFHGDVKPANILLDDNFMPKISDLGISRLIAGDKEDTLYVIGDMNYMDPIYMQTGRLTEKSDVYSFGIVILEVISRKKATRRDKNSLLKSFIEVHEEGKKATELFDKEIAVPGNLEILDCLAEIAVECLNRDVDQRPTMTDIVERLLILNRSRRLQVV